ncbi:hypothetical protein PISL3812_06570 [Talaromyces islandicus]|uniref:DSBA-like thioredoxin domain-containing protein n=1 Tax=Talaromyces islandicus TaxID=28573 RepID=A0A0U1M1Y6_TALIS|nr:hypothetical protein PISL3812_06570 [Talaromyces islandicus]
MTIINIDIISDIVCAWCYIGKKTIEKAISLHQKTYPGGKNDVIKITWRPYYLDYHQISSLTMSSGVLRSSVDKSEVAKLRLSHMSAEQLERLRQRMDRTGRSLGITFKPGGKVGSTRPAHHLIHLCQTTLNYPIEVRDALVARLFEAYHELEKDISSREVLREIAIEAGMDAGQVDECLDSFAAENVQESEVDREARENKEATHSGVPLFTIQGVFSVDGAQDLMDFVEIFGRIREEAQAAA